MKRFFPWKRPVRGILCALSLLMLAVSSHAQFTLEIVPVSPGTGQLGFTLFPGYYYCLEKSGNLAGGFHPASGWMLGDGSVVTWPIQYPTSAASGGNTTATAVGDTFSIYPFNNGKALVTWDGSGGALRRALVAQDYSTLPPLITLPGSQTTPYLTLLLGSLAWDPAYATLDPALLTTAQQTTLARLTSRYAEVLAAASGGSGGPGVVIESPKHFFRLRRVEADGDHDGLSFAQEVFVYGSDPNNADSDGDGIPDGEEIARGLNPGSDDTDSDGAKDGSDAYPNDARRSEDIPVKFYGVIDLTEYLSPTEPFHLERTDGLEMALDDENRVAFAGLVQHPVENQSTLRTVVWKDGVVERDKTLEFPHSPSVPVPTGGGATLSFNRHAWPEAFGLNAQGVVAGFAGVQIIENYEPPDTDYSWPARFTAADSLLIQPLAHSTYPPPSYPLWRPVIFSRKGTAFYVETTVADGAEASTPIFGTTSFTAFQSTRFSGAETYPSEAVASTEDDLVWKLVSYESPPTTTIELYDHATGANTPVSNLPGYATLLAMNSSKQVIGDLRTEEPATTANPNGRGWLGFLWKDGTMQTFHDLLPEKFRKQLRSAVPYFISNVDPVEGAASIMFSAESWEWTESGDAWVGRRFMARWNGVEINYVETMESSPEVSLEPAMSTPRRTVAGTIQKPEGTAPALALVAQFVPKTPERTTWGYDPWLPGDKYWTQGDGWVEHIDLPLKETWTSLSRGGAFALNQKLAIIFRSVPDAESCELYVPPASTPFITVPPIATASTWRQVTINGTASTETAIKTPEVWVLPVGWKNKLPAPTEKDCVARLKVMAMPARTIKVGIWRAAGLAAGVPTDEQIIQKMNEIYKQACIAVVQTHAGTLDPGDWDSDGNGIFSPYGSDRTPFLGNTKMVAKLNIAILPRRDVELNGITLNDNRAAVFVEPFQQPGMDIDDLRYTCAHEVGHMLKISTRSIPPKGLDTTGKGHDGTGEDHIDRPVPSQGIYPDLQWTTDTEQLLMDGRVASPGFYTSYDAAIGHATYFWYPSLMRPGGGRREWLRHEDWKKANDEAQRFE